MIALLIPLILYSSIFVGQVFSENVIFPENISDLNFDYLKNKIDEYSNLFINQDSRIVELKNVSKFLKTDHPHAHLNVEGIINLHEYASQVHTVETEDGYILEMHRITGNKTKRDADGKPVVFLMHGILAGSSDWVLTGPEKGLAFLLADAGWDVWLGNARGNRYSRKHKTLSAEKKKFWQFTWHEIGVYDLPAMIDYILKLTNNEKLVYVGHSQGSTSFLVMLSERPEYNDKIKVMFSLAPVAYVSHITNPFFKYLAKIEKQLRTMLSVTGPWEVLPNKGLYKIISSVLCTGSFKKFCSNIIFMICGFNEEQFDIALIPALTAHIPAGSSINQFFHYGQLVKSGEFRQFNQKIIGASDAPFYNLSNVRVPISLTYANNDWLCSPKDVKLLYTKLPNPIDLNVVKNEKFNHIDFLYAIDVKALLYDKIIATMAEYSVKP